MRKRKLITILSYFFAKKLYQMLKNYFLRQPTLANKRKLLKHFLSHKNCKYFLIWRMLIAGYDSYFLIVFYYLESRNKNQHKIISTYLLCNYINTIRTEFYLVNYSILKISNYRMTRHFENRNFQVF